MDVSNWSDFIWYVCGHSLHMWMSIIGVMASDKYVVIHYTSVWTMDVSNWSDFIWYVCGHSLHISTHDGCLYWSDFIWYVCGHSLHTWMFLIGVISSDMYVVIHYTYGCLQLERFHLICMWSFITHMDVTNWSNFIWYVCSHSLHISTHDGSL